MESCLSMSYQSEEVVDLLNRLQVDSSPEQDDDLERLALASLKLDSGKSEIKLIARVAEVLDAQRPDFFKRFLHKFLSVQLETEFSLHFLCAFCDRIFQDCHQEVNSPAFWRTVQSGLTHQCSLTRKRSLYLSKRFTDQLQNFSPELKDEKLFKGDRKCWEEFYLILESLEEKQVHIVQQILTKLPVLQELDVSWAVIAFKRFFVHQNIIVVRWGIEHFMSYICKNDISYEDLDYLLDTINSDLLQTLNTTKLYVKDQGIHSGQNIVEQLSGCLNMILEKCPDRQGDIINGYVSGICNVSWGPMPLFWISFSLPNLKCGAVLSETSLNLVLELVEHHIVYQEPVLRGAAQQHLLLFIITKSQNLSSDLLEKILYTFWSKKVLFVNTQVWDKIREHLRETKGDEIQKEAIRKLKLVRESSFSPFNLVEKYVISHLLPLVILASESCESLQSCISLAWSEVVGDMNESNRAYAADKLNKNFEETLRLKYLLLKSICDILNVPRRRKGKSFLKYSVSSNSNLVNSELVKEMVNKKMLRVDPQELLAVLKFLQTSDKIESVNIANLYIALLDILPVEEIREDLLQSCASSLNEKCSAVNKIISMKVILHLAEEDISGTVIRSKYLDSYFSSAPLAVSLPDSDNREEQKIIGRLIWDFRNSQQELLSLSVRAGVNYSTQQQTVFEQYAQESVDVGGTDCVLSAIKLVQCLDVPALNFITKVRGTTDEFRKNESFWPVMEALINLVEGHFLQSPQQYVDILINIAKESTISPGLMGLLSQSLTRAREPGIVPVLLEAMAGPDSLEGLMELLTRMITFGPTFRKDQKIVTETNRLISDMGPVFSVNQVEGSDHELSDVVRKQGINNLFLLLSMPCLESQLGHVISSLIKSYGDLQLEATRGRTRHFENSEIHKCKNRMLQCMVLLAAVTSQHPGVDVETKLDLIKYFLDQLLEHNDQTSVRHLLEWSCSLMIAGTCVTCQSDRPAHLLWDWLVKAAQVRMGSVPSFITVIVNLAQQTDKLVDHKLFLERCITETTPWSMAQQYGLRVVSQLGFRKLWPVVQKYPDLENKFQVLNQCMERSIQISSTDKTSTKLMEDFYQSTFNPFQHLTLEDIFIHFPTLCCLPEEEISLKQTLNLLTCLQPFRIGGQSSLEGCAPSKLVSKDPLVQNQNVDNLQRKITPWKSMNIETELEDRQRLSETKERQYPDLIVVASLIDRLPNLGGLCRTCEILGVGKMTVPSALVVKEREFTGVSVTAEQWLPMEEVPEANLIQYIQWLKRSGWSIVAVEQASKSVPLNKFSFPRKCVIILGKEREGVPVEILNEVDHCVEIPQHGLIRSFNVHVTGSIVLWEYVRQRIS